MNVVNDLWYDRCQWGYTRPKYGLKADKLKHLENLNLLKSLSKIRGQLESLSSKHEMFNGTNCEDLKVSMNAHFELFSITGYLEPQQWLVSRMKNTVKFIRAKFLDEKHHTVLVLVCIVYDIILAKNP